MNDDASGLSNNRQDGGFQLLPLPRSGARKIPGRFSLSVWGEESGLENKQCQMKFSSTPPTLYGQKPTALLLPTTFSAYSVLPTWRKWGKSVSCRQRSEYMHNMHPCIHTSISIKRETGCYINPEAKRLKLST